MDGNNRRSRSTLALVWWFGAAALMVACGGGGNDTSGAAAPSPAPSPGAPSPGPAPAPTPSPAPIAQTAAGEPEGLPSFATIGAAGGSLASSDGRLRITVPAGAFAADTKVGIQPITATAPGAFGLAYRLTPEGVTFAQPVTLTFTYPKEEAAAVAAASMRVATRDARGMWSVPVVARDAAARTLSVAATHFSDWSYVGRTQIAPAWTSVRVNEDVVLKIIDCGDAPDPADPDAEPLLRECRSWPRIETEPWLVNGIAGGDGTVGTIEPLDGVASYTAPGSVPASNPVAVSTGVDLPPLPGATPSREVLVSSIKVLDAFNVYEGTAFGRLVTEFGGETQTINMSADLRFIRNTSLSIGGDEWYDGFGTAYVEATPFGCSSGSGTAAVINATLVLHTEGPLAGTYVLGASATPSITVTCDDPPTLVTMPIPGGIVAGGNDVCTALQIGREPGRLAGRWSCNVAEGNRASANWTLRAVE